MKKILLVVLLVSSYSAWCDVRLPTIGMDSHYQLNKEKTVSQQISLRLKQTNKMIVNPLIDHYLKEISYVLLQGLDHRFREYKIGVINDPSINAFAVPGGFIGVNYGLMLAAETEAQLAGVLSHEIAHIRLKHIVQMLNKQSELSNTVLASFFLALVLSQSSDTENKSEAIEALVFGSTAGAQQSLINFTRENEYEADRKGLEIMQVSGYPAIGMAEFFSILEGRVGGGELAAIEYLRTHPVSENRMGEAYQFRSEYNLLKNKTSDDYDFFKIYLNFIADAGVDFESEQNSINQYQLALNQITNNQYSKALDILKELNKVDGENIWVSYVLIDLEIKRSHYAEALVLVNRSLGFNPELPLWISLKMEVLMQQQKYQKAIVLALEELEVNEANQAIRFKLVRVYEQMNDMSNARRTEADYHYIEGNYERAKYLYLQLLNTALDEYVKRQLTEKIKIIEQINNDDEGKQN